MPRFVLLYHECPPHYKRSSHWDFMLESGDVLQTWALSRLPQSWQAWHERTVCIAPDCPQLATSDRIAVEELADHRLAYAELEGSLSGDRGDVKRIASGVYASDKLLGHRLHLTLADDSWRGAAMLSQVAKGAEWLLEVE